MICPSVCYSTTPHLWYFDDPTAQDYAKTQTFGQGVFEAINVCHVKVVNQDAVAFLPNERNCGLPEKGRNIMSDGRDLHQLVLVIVKLTAAGAMVKWKRVRLSRW